jgi:putative nucleotidyltransferase with HDIG domain
MDSQQLSGIFAWFDTYVASFYGQDNFTNANLKLKEEHCRRTVGEMNYLAHSLGLSAADVALAEAIGLLHDVGRFEQFTVYRTYNDTRSTKHGLLGRKILRDRQILAGLDQADMGIIETAIEYHGARELPPAMTGRRLLFSRLIRDADKIDIYEVAVTNYKKYAQDPQNFPLEIEFPSAGDCSGDVVEAVLQGKRVDYRKLKTMEDAQLLQIGWIYDVNFKAALCRIKERRYIETLAAMLPQKPQVTAASNSALAYLYEQVSRPEQIVQQPELAESAIA